MSIRFAFVSGESEVRQALRHLRQELDQMGIGDEDLGLAELVLGEVLNNVVEHAYGEGNGGRIRLTCRASGDALAFCVCDAGRPLPGLVPPPGLPPDLDCAREDLPEGGFGWFLVRSLTSGLTYARRLGYNVLRFRVPLSRPPGRAEG